MVQYKHTKRTAKKARLSSKQGFTLIEIMVALFVFSIAMVAITGIFASFVSANSTAKKTQKALEDSNQAINIMAKVIRASSVVAVSGSPTNTLRVLEYSNPAGPQCLAYRFDGTHIQQTGSVPIISSQIPDCAAANLGAYSNLIETPVTGRFIVDSSAVGHVGKVTIIMDASATTGGKQIQSTVSLRDYQVSNP